MKQQSLELALQYDPFQGDFGDTGDREMGDKIVIRRKDAVCVECLGPISKGERGRRLSMFWQEDRAVRTYNYCTECTRAQAIAHRDDGEAIEARNALRRTREAA